MFIYCKVFKYIFLGGCKMEKMGVDYLIAFYICRLFFILVLILELYFCLFYIVLLLFRDYLLYDC